MTNQMTFPSDPTALKLKVDQGACVIAVDFDGTIVEHSWPGIGHYVPGALEWLGRWQLAGARLMLWTMRGDKTVLDRGGAKIDPIGEAVERLKSHGVHLWQVNRNPEQDDWTNSPKQYAHIYVDDAAYGCPLVYPGEGRRPYVDWVRVGPAVLEMILVWQPQSS